MCVFIKKTIQRTISNMKYLATYGDHTAYGDLYSCLLFIESKLVAG